MVRTYQEVEFSSDDQKELYQNILEILESHDHQCLDNAPERQEVALHLVSELSTLIEV